MTKGLSHFTVFIFILLTAGFLSMTQAQNTVVLQTTHGDIMIEVYKDTPLHSENFIKLVKDGYYDGVLFHRVIAGFMIQTGDPNSRSAQPDQPLGDGGPGYTIPAEFTDNHYHKKGAVAAARLGDQINPLKSSSGSQFYIVQGQVLSQSQLQMLVNAGKHKAFTDEQTEIYSTIGGTPHLDNNYTVFGEVVQGIEVIDKIASSITDQRNRPLNDVRIKKAYVLE